jgi:uroporphyrinogen-III synthase
MTEPHPSGPLSGRGILVTRPREHAARLADCIRAAGGEPVLFPAIEIAPPRDREALERLIAGMERFQVAIFISETAAAKGGEAVLASRLWPEHVRVAAVGGTTARSLERLGFGAVLAPAGRSDSEALAALPELQDVRGKAIVIFRGEGGREWLRQELETRGARVEYAECYRRLPPAAPELSPLLARWQRGGVDAVSITSGEGLRNFFGLLGPTGKDYLRATPVFLPHPRIADLAREQGIRKIVLTGPGEESAVAGMAEFFVKV